MEKIKNKNAMIESICEEAISGKDVADNILEKAATGYMSELFEACSDISDDDSAILAAVFRKMSEHFEEKFSKRHDNGSAFAKERVDEIYQLIQGRLVLVGGAAG